MNSEDFKRLADIRLSEAQTLLDNGKFDGAFYLAGYAVECALKACIASRTKDGDFPPTPEVVRHGYYTHSLEDLFKTAVNTKVIHGIQPKTLLAKKWRVVKDWKETSRYENHAEKKARDMLTSSREVLEWLRRFW